VTFTGFIAEATCTEKAFNKMVKTTCIRDQKVTTSNIEFDKKHTCPLAGSVISTALLRHINEKNNIAILILNYE